MAGDENDEEDENSDDIHLSFKKLKIDPDWDSSNIQHPQCVDIHSIWSGELPDSKESQPPSKRPKNRISPSRRSEPYPVDCVLSFERLCLRKEKCNKKWCLCTCDKSKTTSTSSDCILNFAVDVGGQKKIIHDARLKLHHAQKDHRQIIRAAKLQINEAKRVKAGKEHGKKLKDVLGTKNSQPKKLFGSVSKMATRNFSNVESTGGNSLVSDNELPEEHFFDGHRSTTSTSTGFTSHNKSLLNDNLCSSSSSKACSSSETSPNKVEKSCSQEATIEDLSVDELAGYFDDFVHIPKKMSVMAEMMYT